MELQLGTVKVGAWGGVGDRAALSVGHEGRKRKSRNEGQSWG